MVYGGTEFTLQKNFGFSEQEAKMAVAGYFEGFPGVKVWMDKVYAHFTRHKQMAYPEFGYIKRMDMPDPLLEFQDPKAYQRQFRAALRTCQNALIQGLSAFIVKKAIVGIARELEERGFDAWVCLQIHDEIGCMARTTQAQEVQEVMMRHMQRTVEGVFLGAEPEIKATLSKSEAAIDLEDFLLEQELQALHMEMML